MPTKDHHAAAAVHHIQAAQSHREASRHFEVGKDRAHWAHKALIAHDHTLRAIDCGNEARRHYGEHEKRVSKGSLDADMPFPANNIEMAEAMGTILRQNQQHAVAADHHLQAAHHHDQASRYCAARNYEPAVTETMHACRHAQQSLFHSREALRQNAEVHPGGGLATAAARKNAIREKRI
jgi:hypothetical protein